MLLDSQREIISFLSIYIVSTHIIWQSRKKKSKSLKNLKSDFVKKLHCWGILYVNSEPWRAVSKKRMKQTKKPVDTGETLKYTDSERITKPTNIVLLNSSNYHSSTVIPHSSSQLMD